MKNIDKLIIFILILLIASLSYAETCTIRGDEVTKHASMRGFEFSIACTPGVSSQESRNHACVSAIALADDNIENECIFSLFEKKKLSEEWKFDQATYVGDNFSVLSEPKKSSDNIKIEIKLNPPDNDGRSLHQ